MRVRCPRQQEGGDPPRKHLPRKKIPADLRSLARGHTALCIKVLAGIVSQEAVPPAAPLECGCPFLIDGVEVHLPAPSTPAAVSVVPHDGRKPGRGEALHASALAMLVVPNPQSDVVLGPVWWRRRPFSLGIARLLCIRRLRSGLAPGEPGTEPPLRWLSEFPEKRRGARRAGKHDPAFLAERVDDGLIDPVDVVRVTIRGVEKIVKHDVAAG